MSEEAFRVVAVSAHPDDTDFRAGGTLARVAAAGAKVDALIVTDGRRGSWDPLADPLVVAAERQAEQVIAMDLIGGSAQFLGHIDGSLGDHDLANLREELCLWYRVLRPHLIITHDPWRKYNLHPDHRLVAKAAVQAIVASRNAGFFPEQLVQLDPWPVEEAYLFMSDRPNGVVDVSATIEKKVNMVGSHRSQLPGWAPAASQTDRLSVVAARVRDIAREAASDPSFEFGEEFFMARWSAAARVSRWLNAS